MTVLTWEQRVLLRRHVAALRDSARAREVAADLLEPEFEACWERGEDGRRGRILDMERAIQLQGYVLEGRREVRQERDLADAIVVLIEAADGR